MILVTGGAGFIGSHLVEALLQRNQRVRMLDNLSTGKRENLEEVTGCAPLSLPDSIEGFHPISLGDKAEFLWGDISDFKTCQMACQGISHIFHLAALGSVQRSVEDPIASHQANATGTLNILQAARGAGVKRVIYASSSSVYGNISPKPDAGVEKREDWPTHPQSPYAATKLLGEIYCRIFSSLYELKTVSLRYFNVFGPRQDPGSLYAAVIPKFISAYLTGNTPIVFGDGNQSRDFTYVENVVRANLMAMEATGVSGQVFNIACGQQTTINTLLSSLQRISGRKIPARYEPARKGEVRHSQAAIDLARSHFGYEVKVEFPEGLSATWNWFQKRKR